MTLLPSSLNFGTVRVYHSSAPQTVTLSDSGAPLLIDGWSIGPNFNIVSTTCPLAPSVLPSGQSCTFQVDFEPRSVGIKHATLLVFDSGPRSPQMVRLRGVGVR